MDIIVVFILVVLATQLLLTAMSKKHPLFDRSLMLKLFLYHLGFFLLYYIMALSNPTDSKHYYYVATLRQDDWFGLFETSTNFINFVAVPFVQMGLSYESLMLIFAWFGFVGFVYAYLFFKEHIPQRIEIFKGVDFLTLLLFLPNMHFWTVSLGKGSIIFMGIMMFMYAIKNPKGRFILLFMGGFIAYMVRPHMMFFLLFSLALGLFFGKDRNVSSTTKVAMVIIAVGFLFAASSSVLSMVNLEGSEDVISDFEAFAESRSTELAKAGSGIDMGSYPLPLKLFTFWFRPLFFDAPGFLGLFSSIENLLYLFIFSKILSFKFISFLKNSSYIVKMSMAVFLSVSFGMIFMASNLGIIIRQKSQVMYFGFFVIFSYLAYLESLKTQNRT
ncbi:MAG: hypothetical protein ACK4FS_04905 [Flavobacterium sp.]